MALAYDALPEELRWSPQWCIAGKDEATGKYRAPHYVTAHGQRNASSTNAKTWSDFETVRDYVDTNRSAINPIGLGYVLSDSDPYVCIDIDIKDKHSDPNTPDKWTTPEQLARYQRIIMAFHSYTERSSGGLGYHIWVRGCTAKGWKRDGVEVYSQSRFIACTGDVVINGPIVERQELLDMLVADLRRGEAPVLTLVENAQTEDDNVIFARGSKAANANKFIDLCEGKWKELGYFSQSEADQALMTIFAFYTKSNIQVFRLFRTTKLGQREKATKNDYYLTITIKKVRSIEANEAISTHIGERMALALVANLQQRTQQHAQNSTLQAFKAAPIYIPPASIKTPVIAHAAPASAGPKAAAASIGNLEAAFGGKFKARIDSISEKKNGTGDGKPVPEPEGGIDWPPGLAGEIARHIFQTSPRPVKEVAIVSALGFIAGICGKAFTLPQSGLNLYIILVARSGIGKESMLSGIASLLAAVLDGVPGADKFVNFQDFASGPALTKAVIAQPCFINVAGEWGKKLKRISADERFEGPMQQLRTVMTNLYQKSGPESIFGGIGYSDKEKNISSVKGAAYSLIGDTTPDDFYNSLTESMMADGFLSRFTIVEYTGDRPDANPNIDTPIDSVLIEKLQCIFTRAMSLITAQLHIRVQPDDEAAEMLHTIDLHCDKEVRKTQDEGWRAIWNRAHLKVMRIAANLAAVDNCTMPIMNAGHVQWALDLILRDINIMARKIDAGEIGGADSSRENKLLDLCKTYFTKELAPSHNIPAEMRTDGVIPRKYMQTATQKINSFTSHRLGQILSMDLAIKSLVDGGYFVEVDKNTAIQKYQFHGKCYRVVSLPMSKDEAAAININIKISRK